MSRRDNRSSAKSIRKDQTVRREVLSDLDESTDRPEVGNAEAQYHHGNRDQARGDWDRSRRMDDSE
jgi:hypothetical protein